MREKVISDYGVIKIAYQTTLQLTTLQDLFLKIIRRKLRNSGLKTFNFIEDI